MKNAILADDYKLWKDAYEAKEIKIIWFYFYDSRFKEICRSKEICFTEYLFKQSLEKIKRLYSQYGEIEVHTYTLENKP